MSAFKTRLERVEIEEPVHIPTLDGTGIAETIPVKVMAWRDRKDGEIYFDTEAAAVLDKVKARHMGLLTPEQIKALRRRLGLTQPQISELLQIGEKTWTRWETGRDRPSRSINVLLFALNDGKLDVAYLRSVARRRQEWAAGIADAPEAAASPWLNTVREVWQGWAPQANVGLAHALREAAGGCRVASGKRPDWAFPAEAGVSYECSGAGDLILAHPMKKAVSSGRAVRSAGPGVSAAGFDAIPDEVLVA